MIVLRGSLETRPIPEILPQMGEDPPGFRL